MKLLIKDKTQQRKLHKTMKLTLILLTLVATLMTACGDKSGTSVADLIANGSLEDIRAKKKELADNQRVLEADITMLDDAIGEQSGEKKLPLVTAFEVKLQKFDHFVELQGDVMTKQNVLIYPEMPGTLLQVHVKEGQKVNKGQVLAVIDNGGMSSQIQQLKTQLQLAKTTFERQERLWVDNKIGTEIQYLQSKASYESQKNAVSQMQSQLGKFTIKAPFSGVIDDVIKDQGNVVGPGQGSEVFRIVNLSNMYIEVSVPESHLSTVTVGKDVQVYLPVLSETVKSTVRQTGNYINPNNRSFKVEIAVPNKQGRIKPNLMAKVQINDYRNEEAILIPQSIISENSAGEQYVFVVSKPDAKNVATVSKNIIKTGKSQGNLIEVLSGVKSGQSIIEEGARSVKDGQEVKILSK
jgi:RND family efflux transporter MFP subunit